MARPSHPRRRASGRLHSPHANSPGITLTLARRRTGDAVKLLQQEAAGTSGRRRVSYPRRAGVHPIQAHARQPLYTVGEEIAHAVSHGLGLVLSVAGLVTLVAMASVRGDAWHIVGCAVFGATLVLLYAASTLYHGIRHAHAKRLLQRLDRAAIFLLIAGTYTPFALVSLRGGWGWTLLGLVWSLALL